MASYSALADRDVGGRQGGGGHEEHGQGEGLHCAVGCAGVRREMYGGMEEASSGLREKAEQTGDGMGCFIHRTERKSVGVWPYVPCRK